MNIKHKIRNVFRKSGYDITKYNKVILTPAPLKQLLFSNNISTFLDVGANNGEFAEQIRKELGYTNKIISFEPLSSAFRLLKEKAASDPNWEVFNFALGENYEKRDINIAGNSYSSSLLEMLPEHQKVAPESKYVGKELIEIYKLDDIFNELCIPSDKIYMKIDAQGFERMILKGAEKTLKSISHLQLEMSFVPLYDGEILFDEMYSFLHDKDFKMIAIEPGFKDKITGQLLQVDGFFQRY